MGTLSKLGCVASLLLLVAPAGARADETDALYAKAKAEGALVLYAGGPAAPHEARAKAFAARFPGVAVTVKGGFSNVLDAEIDRQIAERKVAVDLAIFQTLQDFGHWKAAGALAAFKPEGFDAIDASFKDPDGAFVAIAVNAVPYGYNPDLVAAGAVPRSALDFLKPAFKGKLITCYPADDDVTLYVFHLIVERHGWDTMDKYMANAPQFVQGHLGVVRSIGSGATAATFDTMAGTAWAEQRAGGHIEIAIPALDPLPIWPLTAALFREAPHPHAAKLYLTWLLSPEEQARIGTWSPRADVPPPHGMKPIFDYTVANGYRDFVSNAPLVADLRKRFETYTGPVVNTGGVR